MGFQGQKLNVLLTRHVLSKPRMGYHRLPPPTVPFGNATVGMSGLDIKDLVEGNFAKAAERTPHPGVWPPRRPGSAADDGRVHGAGPARGRDEVGMLMSYGYGRVMGEGREHNYAPVENTRQPGRLPIPRPTMASTAKAAAVVAASAPSRPTSARDDPGWKLPQFAAHARPRTRLDGKPLGYETMFPGGPGRKTFQGRIIPSLHGTALPLSPRSTGGDGGGFGHGAPGREDSHIRSSAFSVGGSTARRPQSARV
jgi:hypothetical protein